MDLTRLGHACVRLDAHGAVLVLDPGSFSAAAATQGADVVLITHEHADHVVPAALRAALAARRTLQVWAPAAVVDALTQGAPELAGRVHRAVDGDAFQAAGFEVRVFGGLHAPVHPDVPRVGNLSYLIDAAVLHPGDSFTVPPVPVDVLLVPVSGPWMRLGDAVDHVRAVQPRLAVPIHDALHSPTGLAMVDRLLGPGGIGIGGAEYRRPPDGERASVG